MINERLIGILHHFWTEFWHGLVIGLTVLICLLLPLVLGIMTERLGWLLLYPVTIPALIAFREVTYDEW